ncbi:MAG: glycosyltransferase family 4 protein [Candidatus Edwardsbacteria bacterium]|nr:glycosyltransferase family 4 protein [Candidatus Edwardsbacteria bacterium]
MLPGSSHKPIGGFKVVFEYANRLIKNGHNVTVICPAISDINASMGERLVRYLYYIYRWLTKTYLPSKWFNLDPNVRFLWVPSLNPSWFPQADVIISTAWKTVEYINKFPFEQIKKVILFMDYEYYRSADDTLKKRIKSSYPLNEKYICISLVIKELLQSWGIKEVAYIPVGLDFSIFYKEIEIDAPERVWIGFPTRPELFKRTIMAIDAIDIVKNKFPNPIFVWSYGGNSRIKMPNWIKYFKRPTDAKLRTLYNQTAIFITPSQFEGWGLPGAEAMACGCALVSTDHGGINSYALNDKNAIICHEDTTYQVAQNIISLLKDKEKRITLAQNAIEDIKIFTWDKSVALFESVLKSI